MTTDVEKEKKSRKNRRKKNYSSSSSEESNPTKINIKPLPEIPTASNMILNKPSTSKIPITTHQSTPSLAHKKPAIAWPSLFEESMSSDGSYSADTDRRDENLDNSKHLLNYVNNEQKSGSDGKNSINYNLTVYNVYQDHLTNKVTFVMEVC